MIKYLCVIFSEVSSVPQSFRPKTLPCLENNDVENQERKCLLENSNHDTESMHEYVDINFLLQPQPSFDNDAPDLIGYVVQTSTGALNLSRNMMGSQAVPVLNRQENETAVILASYVDNNMGTDIVVSDAAGVKSMKNEHKIKHRVQHKQLENISRSSVPQSSGTASSIIDDYSKLNAGSGSTGRKEDTREAGVDCLQVKTAPDQKEQNTLNKHQAHISNRRPGHRSDGSNCPTNYVAELDTIRHVAGSGNETYSRVTVDVPDSYQISHRSSITRFEFIENESNADRITEHQRFSKDTLAEYQTCVAIPKTELSSDGFKCNSETAECMSLGSQSYYEDRDMVQSLTDFPRSNGDPAPPNPACSGNENQESSFFSNLRNSHIKQEKVEVESSFPVLKKEQNVSNNSMSYVTFGKAGKMESVKRISVHENSIASTSINKNDYKTLVKSTNNFKLSETVAVSHNGNNEKVTEDLESYTKDCVVNVENNSCLAIGDRENAHIQVEVMSNGRDAALNLPEGCELLSDRIRLTEQSHLSEDGNCVSHVHEEISASGSDSSSGFGSNPLGYECTSSRSSSISDVST